MRCYRHGLALKERAALLWAFVFFACFQVALAVLMERPQPELRDPEYGYKLMRLLPRGAHPPRRSLTVVLGSSRAALGFRPDALAFSGSEHGETPLVFNFAFTGAGPIMELLCLRRLLGAGIHPDRVIVEILPLLLYQAGSWSEENWLHANRLGFNDVRSLRRYTDHPMALWGRWIGSRSVPWFSHRFCIMSRYAPGWLPWECRQDGWRGMDDAGWLPYPRSEVDAEEYRRGLEYARGQYASALDHFEISAKPDRALRELLELCRREHIAVVLVLMPEGSEFQSWYSSRVRAEIDAYLVGLKRQYQIPLVDTRSWMSDPFFFDGHHLLPGGARLFTERFARDVFRPLLRTAEKEPLSGSRATPILEGTPNGRRE